MGLQVLVTGGSGYLGQGLLRALAAREDVEAVVDVDLRPPAAALPKVRFVQRSVTEDLTDLFTGPAPVDVAVHLAWVVNPMRDEAAQRAICLGGTARFLAACAAAGVKQVLFCSSATAYGAHPAHDRPLDEGAELRPGHHFQYSREKREAEGLVREFARAHPRVLVQVARPVVVGGPHVSNFIFRSMEKRPALLPLGHDPQVQLVHEDDCAEALAAILASRLPGAFNIAADGSLALSEIARRLGQRPTRVPVPLMLGLAWVAWRLGLASVTEAPPGFVWFVALPWLASNRRLKEEVGFRFRYDCAGTLDTYLQARARPG